MQLFRPTRTNPTPASRCKAWLAIPVVVLSLSTALFCRPAAAQSGQQFVGHIADPSGGSIAGATVTVHNEDTGEDVVAKTTGAGDYTVPYLQKGTYTVTVSQTGFKAVSKTHITLSIDQTSKIDFTLPIGAVSESVTVSSEGAQIELSKADRGEIIGNERVEEMPSDGRNYMVLFGLSPGTSTTANPQYPRQEDNYSTNLYVGGVRQGTVQENLDGGTNDTANGWAAANVPLDTVSEFKVVLNPYDASYGRAGGGAIDVALKSGTNQLHGSLYEFARRPWLDAQNYSYDFARSHGTTSQRPSQHKRDMFGVEVDGPVSIPHFYNGRDKTFFTAQWEQGYENLPDTGAHIDSVPDPNWANGNFGYSPSNPLGIQYYDNNPMNGTAGGPPVGLLPLPIYDPLLPRVSYNDPVDNTPNKQARQQFAGNTCGGPQGTYQNPVPNPVTTQVVCVIPQNRIDPVGKAIAQFYNQLAPNYDPGAGFAPFQNNHFYVSVENDITRSGLVKLSQNFGSSDRGSLLWTGYERYATRNFNGIPPSSAIYSGFNQVQPSENLFSIDEVHTFSPNLILDNKITVGTQKQGIASGTPGFNLTTLGFAPNYVNNILINNYFPNVTTNIDSNHTEYFSLANGGTRGFSAVHNLGYQPSFTLIKGRHTIRAGFDMRLYQYANFGNVQNNRFGFQRNFTQHFVGTSDAPGMQSGSSLAELLLGYPTNGSLVNQTSPFWSQHYFAIWAQDDWKATPKLTLNFGIRYDLLEARTERHNKVNYGFNTSTISPIDSQIIDRSHLHGPIIGGLQFAGVNGNPRGAYATNLLNLQPRFGMAYAFSSRTSLRAGFGEMYIQDEQNNSSNGYAATTNFNPSNDAGITPSLNNPCVPGSTGCALAPAGNTLADPYPSILQVTAFGTGLSSPATNAGLATTPGGSINFTDPNFTVPSLWQFSVSLEQLLTRHDILDISYSGNRGYNISGNDDINHVPTSLYAQCDIERGGNRQLCDNPNDPNVRVASPFYNIPAFKGTGYYTNSKINYLDLNRPFPQFTSVTEQRLPLIHSWYNSLQVTLAHNVSRDLSFHLAYTWSKSMNAGNIIDTVNRVYQRTLDSHDTPNALSISSVYFLPVGRGKTILGHTNRFVDAAVGGWEISPLYIYTQWYPWSPGNNFETISPIAVRMHDLPSDSSHNYKRLQAVSPCVEYKNQDTGVLTPGPTYTEAKCTAPTIVRQTNISGSKYASNYSVQQNIVYTGVRLPANHQFDISISKRFAWSERANLQLRLDAFNVLNHPNWTYGNSYNNDPTSTDWGSIAKGPTSPSGSTPRDLQISGKITF